MSKNILHFVFDHKLIYQLHVELVQMPYNNYLFPYKRLEHVFGISFCKNLNASEFCGKNDFQVNEQNNTENIKLEKQIVEFSDNEYISSDEDEILEHNKNE